MSVFVIVPLVDPGFMPGLRQAIEGGDYKFHRLPRGDYLVAYNGTSRELSEALGINAETSPPALVVSISGYWGRASNEIWEWIKNNWGADA